MKRGVHRGWGGEGARGKTRRCVHACVPVSVCVCMVRVNRIQKAIEHERETESMGQRSQPHRIDEPGAVGRSIDPIKTRNRAI